MAYLIDTSVLARLANTGDSFHPVAARALLELHRAGEVLHLTAQNLFCWKRARRDPLMRTVTLQLPRGYLLIRSLLLIFLPQFFCPAPTKSPLPKWHRHEAARRAQDSRGTPSLALSRDEL